MSGKRRRKTKKTKVGFTNRVSHRRWTACCFFQGAFFIVVWVQAKKVRVAVLGRLFGDACEKAVGTCTCTFDFRVVVVGKGRDVAVRVPGVRAHTHAIILQVCLTSNFLLSFLTSVCPDWLCFFSSFLCDESHFLFFCRAPGTESWRAGQSIFPKLLNSASGLFFFRFLIFSL